MRRLRALLALPLLPLSLACGSVVHDSVAVESSEDAAPARDGAVVTHDAAPRVDAGSPPGVDASDEGSPADADASNCSMQVTGAVNLTASAGANASAYIAYDDIACLSCSIATDAGYFNAHACFTIPDAGSLPVPPELSPYFTVDNGTTTYGNGSGCVVHIDEYQGFFAPFAATFECDSLWLQTDGGASGPGASVKVTGSIATELVEVIKG